MHEVTDIQPGHMLEQQSCEAQCHQTYCGDLEIDSGSKKEEESKGRTKKQMEEAENGRLH